MPRTCLLLMVTLLWAWPAPAMAAGVPCLTCRTESCPRKPGVKPWCGAGEDPLVKKARRKEARRRAEKARRRREAAAAAKLQAEIEAARQAAARRQAAEGAREQAEAEARNQAEARKEAEEAARKKAEKAAQERAEAAAREQAVAEAQRQAEAKKRAEAEARRRAQLAQQRADAETRPQAETAGPGWRRVLGGIGLAAGLASVATGAALWAVDERPTCDAPQGEINCPRRLNTDGGGIALVAVGGAALVTGVVLLVLDRRDRSKRQAFRAGPLLVNVGSRGELLLGGRTW